MNESEYIKYVALDVEMTQTTGPGPEPTQVAITDINGNVLFNEYFTLQYPPRIEMSKARKKKIIDNARRSYNDEARADVLSKLHGKIVVGHDLINDFKALRINPVTDGLAGVIDSAKLPIFKKIEPVTFQRQSLKHLTSEFLHRNIQDGVMHNAFEDAKASANLIRTTFPYLNAPMPVTREMVAKSKVIINYGRRMGLNAEAAAPAPPPPALRAAPPAAPPPPAPAPAALRAVPPSAVNALMLAARRIAQAYSNAETGARVPNLLQFEHPGRSAENYLKEMEGLNKTAKLITGRNNRKKANRRKTRRLRL